MLLRVLFALPFFFHGLAFVLFWPYCVLYAPWGYVAFTFSLVMFGGGIVDGMLILQYRRHLQEVAK